MSRFVVAGLVLLSVTACSRDLGFRKEQLSDGGSRSSTRGALF